MTEQEVQKAPFDDCRAALVFALNAHRVTPPTAFMNKMMASVRVEMKKPRKKRKVATMGEFFGPDAMTAEELLEEERKRIKQKRGGSLVRVEALRWRDGLDKHHQAGLILHHFGRLDREHQIVLSGLLIQAYDPCSCKALCCSGWRANPKWLQALEDMCTILKRKHGSQPALRRMVVEAFFTKRELAIADLARLGKVSYVTAAKHRTTIETTLADLETAAWLQVAPIFDSAGITGHHL
jgi:hypothetical protein